MSVDPDIVGVLPVEVVGDSMYQPLSRGLAHILISDLALLQRWYVLDENAVPAERVLQPIAPDSGFDEGALRTIL